MYFRKISKNIGRKFMKLKSTKVIEINTLD